MNWTPITSPPEYGQLVLTYSPETPEEDAFRILRFGGHPRGFPDEVRFWMELTAPERQDAPEHRCGLQGYNPMLGDTCPACDAFRGRAPADETHEEMALRRRVLPCICSRGKGIDFDENGEAYCIECEGRLPAAASTHEDMAEAHGRRVDETLLGLREPEPEPEEYTPAPLPGMPYFERLHHDIIAFRVSQTSPPGNLLNHPMVKYAGRYVGGMADSFSWDAHKLAKMPIGDLEELLNLLEK